MMTHIQLETEEPSGSKNKIDRRYFPMVYRGWGIQVGTLVMPARSFGGFSTHLYL